MEKKTDIEVLVEVAESLGAKKMQSRILKLLQKMFHDADLYSGLHTVRTIFDEVSALEPK